MASRISSSLGCGLRVAAARTRSSACRACRSRTAGRAPPRRPAAAGAACRPRPASPSTVVISRAVGLHGEHQARADGSPSSSTVQAPQTPCSQPTWVPVRARSSRRKSQQQRARLDERVVRRPVDGDRDAHLVRHPSLLLASDGPGDGGVEGPAGQHGGEVAAEGGRGVGVADRVRGRRGQRGDLPQHLVVRPRARERGFGLAGADRTAVHPAQRDAGRRHVAVLVERDDGRRRRTSAAPRGGATPRRTPIRCAR